MADILLLEPNYRNKYPPLGLMKISYYHKEIKKDHVRFAKGHLPEIYKNKKWDRIYITTLFTFEWEETIRTIEYAKQIVKSKDEILIGGIAASLMPNEILQETGIKPVTGLLNEKGKIGYEDDDIIDTITPDYSMLNEVQYTYPYANAYFMYTTRGCGMNCGFCAVKILEPKFINRISIKEQINEINKRFGEKKDLLLMDNNVLKSPLFNDIVDEIKEVGFRKGATYINPASGKRVIRCVDFNQGLDAFLMTEEKAKKLSELAIRPLRIAFDHIEDAEVYKTAVKRCAKYGIQELSNYILYNSESFSGKGNVYKSDTPEELYERLRITLELKEEINNKLPESKKITIFSFPMRYIPLTHKKRGFVNRPNWNEKYLRAIQVMMMPTQGKGVSGRGFFEADFGKDLNEFKKILLMPEEVIMSRGIFEEIKQGKNETKDEKVLRRKKWEDNKQIWNEWERLYGLLNEFKPVFTQLIIDNTFSYEKWQISYDSTIKKLFIYYLSYSKLLLLINEINENVDLELIFNYCTQEFPLFFRKLSRYVYQSKIPHIYLEAFIKLFREMGFRELIKYWFEDKCNNDYFLNNLERISKPKEWDAFDVDILRILKSYFQLNCLSEDEKDICKRMIQDLNFQEVIEILKKNFDQFAKSLNHTVKGLPGEKELKRQIKQITDEIYKQLTLF